MDTNNLYISTNPVCDVNSLQTLTGKKATQLYQLNRYDDFLIPPFITLTTEYFNRFISYNNIDLNNSNLEELKNDITSGKWPDDIYEILDACCDQLSSPFAVRSSGVHEDGADNSFAGLYDSFLFVEKHYLLDKIKCCWISAFNDRAISYINDNGITADHLTMGVIIQNMVPAEKSGVAFSINPITGKDTEILIEASDGVADKLVSGRLNPEQVRYDWFDDIFIDDTKNKSNALNSKQSQRIAHLCLQIQRHLGYPVDIEWAIADSKIFLIQARPITKVGFSDIKDEWTTADFKDGGVSSSVCTPLMWSLYLSVWTPNISSYLKKVNMVVDPNPNTLWGKMYFGRPYWNVGIVKSGLKKLPGFVERKFDEDLGIQPAYDGDGYVSKTNLYTLFRGIKVLYLLNKSFSNRLIFIKLNYHRIQNLLNNLDKLQTHSPSDSELFTFYKKLILEYYYECESIYFNLVFDNSNVITLFKDFLSKYDSDNRVLWLNLFSGLNNLSHLRQSQDLWEVVEKIKLDNSLLDFWTRVETKDIIDMWDQNKPEVHLIKCHVEKFKHHSTRELDLTIPRFGEDPTFIINTAKIMITSDELEPSKAVARQNTLYENEKERIRHILPPWRQTKFLNSLKQVREFLWWREEIRDLSTQMYYHVRRFSLEVEKRLIASGCLQQKGDIYFCTFDDIFNLFSSQSLSDSYRNIILNNKIYYDSFRNYDNPNEIGCRYLQKTSSHDNSMTSDIILKGLACSPGIIEGTVRIIQDIDEIERLQQGDILVTPFTDPGWTTQFGRIKAVITETGGLLSHAAVISREYGIPAILGVADATRILKNGQKIKLNGEKGEIVVLKE
ncbi:MAG: PEP/pyruvate-binding domain-containing protein [Candidatus Thiodiazotropha sp.]